MEDREKYLGESLLSKQPEKKLILTLRDGSVTTDKIADKSVTPGKLADSVKTEVINPLIASLDGKISALDKKTVKSITLNGSNKIEGCSIHKDMTIELQDGEIIISGNSSLNELLEGVYAESGLPLILPLKSIEDTISYSNVVWTPPFSDASSLHQQSIVWSKQWNRGFLLYNGNYYAEWASVPGEIASSEAYKNDSGNIYYTLSSDLLTFYRWNADTNELAATGDKQDFYFIPINTSDLDIRDEENNVLVEFRNGHIRTQNFDSSQIMSLIETLRTTSSVKIVGSHEDITNPNVVYFVEDPSNTDNEGDEGSNVGLVVSLSILIPLIVIALVVLGILYYRRRNKRAEVLLKYYPEEGNPILNN